MRITKTIKFDRGRHIFWRTSLITLGIFLGLLGFSMLTDIGILGIVGVTSLASSTTNIAVDPNSLTNTPKHLYGGYIIGTLAGILCYYISRLMMPDLPNIIISNYHAFFGAIAVGLSIFVMLALRMTHAPATGFSLALVIEQWDPYTLLAMTAYVIFLSLLGYFLRGRFGNLV